MNNFKRLKPSDRGPEVADVQRRLKKLGYDVGKFAPDQIYGPRTSKAVKLFRAECGLPEGDIIDEATWKLLVERTYELGGRLLYLKSPNYRGRDVHDLQVKLNQLGFHAGQIDGIFGPNTYHALQEFQREFGIAEDGIFGPECLRSFMYLRKVFAENTSVEFAERDRSGSVVRALDGRRVYLDIEPIPADAPVDPKTVHAYLFDWGLRLGNLLEIMNSLVAYGPGFDFEQMIFDDDLDFELAKRGNESDSEIRILLGIDKDHTGSIEIRMCPFGEFSDPAIPTREIQLRAAELAENFSEKLGKRFDATLKILKSESAFEGGTGQDKKSNSQFPEAAKQTIFNEKKPVEPICLAIRAVHYGYNIQALREADEESRQKIAIASFDAIKDLYLAESIT